MLHIVVTSVCIISGFHVVLGLISIVVGIVSSIKAEVWLAHSVSPIWSGGFVSILPFFILYSEQYFWIEDRDHLIVKNRTVLLL